MNVSSIVIRFGFGFHECDDGSVIVGFFAHLA